MGLRVYILALLGAMAVLVLFQMGLSWRTARSMGGNIRRQSGEITRNLAEVIRRSELERIELTMLAGTADLKMVVRMTEEATLLSGDFFMAQSALARSSAELTEAIREGVKRHLLKLLKDRLSIANGTGATFEHRAFSNELPYFLPYAYWEDGEIKYADVATVEVESDDPASITEEERALSLKAELALPYYVASLPADHDRSRARPEKVNWSPPYIDEITGHLMISATAPLNLEGAGVLGVVYIDLNLSSLEEITRKVTAKLPSGSLALSFSAATGEVLASPNQPAWAPAQVDSPQSSEGRTIQFKTLEQLPFGRDVAAVFKGLAEDKLGRTSGDVSGRPHTLFVFNVVGLFGLVVLIPDETLYAAAGQAQAMSAEMDRSQLREMRKITMSAAVCLILVAAALAVISTSILRATRRLGHIVNHLSGESQDIEDLAGAVSQTAATLETDAVGQSRAIADASEALRHISEQVRANAQATEQCGQAMDRATGQAVAVEAAMAKMSEAIAGMSQATSEIVKTLKTINTISFQTNLLALNAAVEAARAGEAGAGFAIVADEVRKLAGLTTEAASRSEALIAEANRRVDEGQAVKAELEADFKDIEETVRLAAGQVDLIRTATRDQAQAVDSVNSDMKALDLAVKRNEEVARQSLKSSQSLLRRAGALEDTSRSLDQLTHGGRPEGRQALVRRLT